jgi:DNA repair protein RadA/Sms
MAKAARSIFVCQNCGAAAPRWTGKCAGCGEWNTMTEETDAAPPPAAGLTRMPAGKVVALETLKDASDEDLKRLPTGIAELDRVTGGGIVPGSALLIGGEPGIGKSTLLLQVAAALAETGRKTLYFTGEEATAQVRLRARRLGVAERAVAIAAETSVSNILATAGEGPTPDLIIVDSVQTLWTEGLEAVPGTISQVRAATQSLVRFAKAKGAALMLVGHVTKDGQIAGPKVVEHMVDTVLYFEGDRGHPFRILRATKNRFGATDEIGVFEMVTSGLREVLNPSELFLGDRLASTSGSAVFAGVEGTRPILVEIQALVVPATFGTPRRAVVGWDSNRLAMLLAVIDARCGISFGQHDVYLSVAGGLKITEPAVDLAAAAALLSSILDVALPTHDVYFGEISLSGALRQAGHVPARLKEARKLGFKRAIHPQTGDMGTPTQRIEMLRLAHVKGLVEALGLQGTGKGA